MNGEWMDEWVIWMSEWVIWMNGEWTTWVGDWLQPTDKKAHHNALERKRRDHIKESFIELHRCLPTVNKHDRVSRPLFFLVFFSSS